MNKSIFSRVSTADRLSSKFLGTQLKSFAAFLQKQRYSPGTIQQYIRECNIFGWWLKSINMELYSVNDKLVDRYLSQTLDLTKSKTTGKRRVQIRPAILSFVNHLREMMEICFAADESGPISDVQQWLSRYQQHLDNVLGLAPGTQDQYIRFVARFLKMQAPDGVIKWTSITADTIVEFVQTDAALRKGCGPQRVVVAIRSFLRFLVSQGVITAGLETAIPVRRRYPQAPPQRLTETEVTHLLESSVNDAPHGKRNYAILMLLLRLGLRAWEVIRLRLSDVDWVNGCLLIRASKTRCERTVPLLQDVGEALLSYLQFGRPQSSYCEIFLEQTAPFHPLKTSVAITYTVKGLLAKAGIERYRSGAHLLRHTVASQMVNSGASFFDVADLLGHRSVRTTAIYAKLNLVSLSQVALPWVGGDQ